MLTFISKSSFFSIVSAISISFLFCSCDSDQTLSLTDSEKAISARSIETDLVIEDFETMDGEFSGLSLDDEIVTKQFLRERQLNFNYLDNEFEIPNTGSQDQCCVLNIIGYFPFSETNTDAVFWYRKRYTANEVAVQKYYWKFTIYHLDGDSNWILGWESANLTDRDDRCDNEVFSLSASTFSNEALGCPNENKRIVYERFYIDAFGMNKLCASDELVFFYPENATTVPCI